MTRPRLVHSGMHWCVTHDYPCGVDEDRCDRADLVTACVMSQLLYFTPGDPSIVAPMVVVPDGSIYSMTEWDDQIEEGIRRTRNDS